MKRLFSVLFSMKGLVGAALGFITLLAPTLALADELNSGDTAWMITATVLVLMMTILIKLVILGTILIITHLFINITFSDIVLLFVCFNRVLLVL